MRKELLKRRQELKEEIDTLNKLKFEKKSAEPINKKVEELKKEYNFINKLIKVIK